MNANGLCLKKYAGFACIAIRNADRNVTPQSYSLPTKYVLNIKFTITKSNGEKLMIFTYHKIIIAKTHVLNEFTIFIIFNYKI